MSVDQSAVALPPPAGVSAPVSTPSRQRRPPAAPAAARVWTATGLERQVFLDGTGRRGRFVASGGALLVLLATLWFAGLVTGAVGFSGLPALRAAPVLAQKPSPQRGSHVAVRSGHHRSFKVASAGSHPSDAATTGAGHINLD